MTTYTKEPGYIYIVTSYDKRTHQPKADDDEVWHSYSECWKQTELPGWGFSSGDVYRRKIAAVAPSSPWLPCDATTDLPAHVTDDTHMVDMWSAGDQYRQLIYPSVFPIRYPSYSHYRLVELPPVPTAEQLTQGQQDQMAFNRWASTNSCYPTKEECYLAGVKHGREQ